MLNIPQEFESIHGLIHKAYYQCSSLKTIVINNGEANPQFCGELDKLVTGLEQTVLRVRYLGEISYKDIQPMEKTVTDYEKHWSGQTPPGNVEVDSNGWLHITLHTLLRLLYGFRQSGHTLPRYDRALLVINEHCDMQSRQLSE